jgi:hypothetical protein
MVVGGTAAAAATWAGLIAINNELNGKSAGFMHPRIYASKAASAFNDIVAGNNGAFSAGPGWDPCTGLGSPIGTKLVTLFGASNATQKEAVSKKTVRRRGRVEGALDHGRYSDSPSCLRDATLELTRVDLLALHKCGETPSSVRPAPAGGPT